MNARNLALILVSSLAICATPARAQIYWGYGCTDEVCGDGTGGIQRANLDGTGVETLVTGLSRVPCITLDVADGKMYWSTFYIPPENPTEPIGKIQRANLDGTNVEDIVSLSVPFQTGLFLDTGARKIYWAEARVDAIQRANLDGSDVENVIVFQNRVFADPYGIALNRTDGKFYWTDFARNAVFRISLDGSGPEEVLITDLEPQDIALDSLAGKMYVADYGNSRILRANLDGSDVETIVQGGSPVGVALNLPTGKIYWTSYHDGRILRANFDGSDIEALVGGIPTVEAITLANACGDGIVELPEACDDGNTADGDCCTSTCQYEATGSPCDDGDACTQIDSCQTGVCTGAGRVTCVALDGCHVAGICDPTTGQCSNPDAANGTACDDGDACTQPDGCTNGQCVGTNAALCSLSPARVWVGLRNSDDVGTKFDLLIEVYNDATLVGWGQLNGVAGGSSGFNNAKLSTIPLTQFAPAAWPAGSTLGIKLYVRNTCFGRTHNSGTARLWYNDAAANTQFGAMIGSASTTYFLVNGFTMGTGPGPGPKKTIDVAAGKPCSEFKPFGMWRTTP